MAVLALSSVPAAVRTMAGFAAERKANLLALLMLAVNLAGIVVSFLSGDPRAMIAKDSLVSSVIAIAILSSVALQRPLMSAGLKPFMTKPPSGPRPGTGCPLDPGSPACWSWRSARSGP